MKVRKVLIVLAFCVFELVVGARHGFGRGPQEWNYVEVREGAHMFWWLHYTTANTPSYTDRPLILWLQGGPGASSTGFGNFEIIGPLDLNQKERNSSWVNTHNVLFVDNPVGTGFSYVDHFRYLTKDNKQIARDLIEMLRGFYEQLPEFKTVPLHIFGESYGGKMAIEFAQELHEEIKNGKIESNLVTVAMGDSWISPIDSTLSWAPYLLQLGLVDQDGFRRIDDSAQRTKREFERGNFQLSTNLWYRTEVVVMQQTHGIDFYNVLSDVRYSNSRSKAKLFKLNPQKLAYNVMVNRRRFLDESENKDDDEDEDAKDKLNKLMRGPVHEALNIPKNVIWGSQSRLVFSTLSGDFMKPVIEVVENVLNNTKLKVVVYSGQLDLICSTPGTVQWVNNMNWNGKREYLSATRNGIGVNNFLEGYSRKFGHFSMYWINKGGHMAPIDNPRAMGYILRELTNFG